jgi:hypothetical protein
MTLLAHLPADKRRLLEQLTAQLSRVPGVVAVVLGGSYASGTQRADSDIDLGLYYSSTRPFAIAELRSVAEAASQDGKPTVTGFYEWGRWVNGGAWIHTGAGKVDFLYREIEKVQQTIAEAQQGIVQHDYDQQPAYGFYSVIYLAELEICIPLYDRQELIAGLKSQVAGYPSKLKEHVVRDSLWSAEFSLLHANGFAARGDVYNTAGCLTRSAANLTQALFALNERYFLNDKHVLGTLASFTLLPDGYYQQVQQVLACTGSDSASLGRSVALLRAAWQSLVDLAGELYAPRFNL